MSSLRVTAWNLGHQLTPTIIAKEVWDAIEDSTPDVVILTEVMPRGDTKGIEKELARMGLQMAPHLEGHRVLVAARERLELGDLAPPPDVPHAAENFLHVCAPSLDLELIGVRVPMFKVKSTRAEYWAWLESAMTSWSERRMIVAGDLNADPCQSASIGGGHLDRLRAHGWRISDPLEPWSYPPRFVDGQPKGGSRLDHLLVSSSLNLIGANYVVESRGLTVSRTKPRLADHALLLAEVAI